MVGGFWGCHKTWEKYNFGEEASKSTASGRFFIPFSDKGAWKKGGQNHKATTGIKKFMAYSMDLNGIKICVDVTSYSASLDIYPFLGYFPSAMFTLFKILTFCPKIIIKSSVSESLISESLISESLISESLISESLI